MTPSDPGPDPGQDDRASPDAPDDVRACVDVTLRASRALLGVVASSLTPVLEHVTLPQFRALVLLSTLGPTRIGVLAQRLGVHQSTFTRTTDRMVDAGIVRRVENPENRREVLVEATGTGMAFVREVTDRRRGEIERILAQFDPEGRRSVCLAMEAFAEVAGEPPAEALAMLGG